MGVRYHWHIGCVAEGAGAENSGRCYIGCASEGGGGAAPREPGRVLHWVQGLYGVLGPGMEGLEKRAERPIGYAAEGGQGGIGDKAGCECRGETDPTHYYFGPGYYLQPAAGYVP